MIATNNQHESHLGSQKASSSKHIKLFILFAISQVQNLVTCLYLEHHPYLYQKCSYLKTNIYYIQLLILEIHIILVLQTFPNYLKFVNWSVHDELERDLCYFSFQRNGRIFIITFNLGVLSPQNSRELFLSNIKVIYTQFALSSFITFQKVRIHNCNWEDKTCLLKRVHVLGTNHVLRQSFMLEIHIVLYAQVVQNLYI